MARKREQTAVATATRILDVAEEMAQRRGFNGFSYADIAAALGVTTATLHYYFPSKGDLGRVLIERYEARFAEALRAIEAGFQDARVRLDAYADVYAAVLREHRFCLCGMLAAEYETLPGPMRDAVVAFFDQNEAWLTRVLELGRGQGTLQFSGSAADAARTIISGLEGAMLVARPYGDVGRFTSAAAHLLTSLGAAAEVAS